jgi:hypothetical protein
LIWILLGLGIIVAVFFIVPQPPAPGNQPVYNGRTLEQWLDVGAHSGKHWVWGPRNDGKGPNPRELREAEESVQAIGTNAIPTLLEWISYKPGSSKRFVRGLLTSVHLPQQVTFFLSGGYKHESRSDLAALGFTLLSTNALPAREGLSKLVRDEKDGGRQSALGTVLFSVTNAASQ